MDSIFPPNERGFNVIKTYINTRQRGIGLLLIFISLLGFGFMQVFVSLTGERIGVMEQTFFRNLIGFFVVGAIAIRKKVPLLGTRSQQLPLFGRSLSGFFAVIALFYALRHAAQADVTIVSRLTLFTVMLTSALLFHEKLTKLHVLAMVLAFAGAWIAVNPRLGSSLLPMLSAFACAVASTVAYVLLSYFSGRISSLTVVMHFCTVSTLASVPLMWRQFVMPTGWDLFCLLMIGTGAAVGQVSMTYAYRFMPAGELNIYNQLSILLNAFMAYVFLGQEPGSRTVVGGLLTLAASFLLFYFKKKE